MRTLNPAGEALRARKLAGEDIPVITLVQLATTVPQRWALCGRELVWGAFTWSPMPVAVSDVENSATGLADITLVLPGVTPSQLAFAFEDLDGTAISLFDAWVNPDTGQVADAPLVWVGECDVPGLQDGAEASVLIKATHLGNAALRPKPLLYTDEQQQRLYPGDTSMNVDPGTDAASVVWPAASYFKQS